MNVEKDSILKNPNETDFKSVKKIVSKISSQSDEQMHLPMKRVTNFMLLLGSIKYRLKKRAVELEVYQAWKSISISFSIVTSFLTFFILSIGGVVVFKNLPTTIPLLYNSAEKRWDQADKSFIFVLAIFVGILELMSIQFILKIYNHDKRLSNTFSWLITYLNLMLWFAISQIYSLIG
jgi:hypothetical protein